MCMTLLLDPGACVRIAMYYLTKGADVFDKGCLAIAVDAYSDKLDRLHLLIRLYLLATSLALPVLAGMAFEELVKREAPMSTGEAINLASLIFSPKIGFDRRMRLWCMKHLAYYVQHLKTMPQWITLLPSLDQDFRKHWDDLTVATNPRFSWPVDEDKLGKALEEPDSDEEIVRQLVRDTSMPGFNLPRSFAEATAAAGNQNSDEDWEHRKSKIIGYYGGENEEDEKKQGPITPPRRASARKALSQLKFSPHKNKEKGKGKELDIGSSSMAWADEYAEQASPEVAKAVAILGMNEMGGRIIAHTRPRRVSRMKDKLAHA